MTVVKKDDRPTYTLSDGTEVVIRPPGPLYLEAVYKTFPDFDAEQERAAERLEASGDAATTKRNRAMDYRLAILTILHGTVTPRFSEDLNPPRGFRSIESLVDQSDFWGLATAIGELYQDALGGLKERVIPFAETGHASQPSQASPGPSAADPPITSKGSA